MAILLWDASALVKRYLNELGSATVDLLWSAPQVSSMAAAVLGYVEVAALLKRKQNNNALPLAAFQAARSLLRQEVFGRNDFALLTVDATLLNAVPLIDLHNINASDAAILAAFLRYAPLCADTCLLVASDQRLLRAAAAEGLATLNPEAMSIADLPDFLATL